MVKNCLENLHICKAECCRQFQIILPQPFDKSKLQIGAEIGFYKQCDSSKQRYYKLHNVRYVFGRIFVKLEKFKVVDNILTVYTDCKGLTPDNFCKFHGKPSQPLICRRVGQDVKGITVTENCIFK